MDTANSSEGDHSLGVRPNSRLPRKGLQGLDCSLPICELSGGEAVPKKRRERLGLNNQISRCRIQRGIKNEAPK